MCFPQECLEIREGTVNGIDIVVIGNIVAIIAQRRGIERQQPEGCDTQFVQIFQLLGQAGKVAYPARGGIAKGPDMGLVYHRLFIPNRVVLYSWRGRRFAPCNCRKRGDIAKFAAAGTEIGRDLAK